MIQTQITIINKLGLHARAAAKFVSTSNRFSSAVDVHYNGKTVNGKSIMSVIMLAASKGCVLELTFDGEDEQAAKEAVVTLINNYFDEGE